MAWRLSPAGATGSPSTATWRTAAAASACWRKAARGTGAGLTWMPLPPTSPRPERWPQGRRTASPASTDQGLASDEPKPFAAVRQAGRRNHNVQSGLGQRRFTAHSLSPSPVGSSQSFHFEVALGIAATGLRTVTYSICHGPTPRAELKMGGERRPSRTSAPLPPTLVG